MDIVRLLLRCWHCNGWYPVIQLVPLYCPNCFKRARWTTEPLVGPAPKVALDFTRDDREFLKEIRITVDVNTS